MLCLIAQDQTEKLISALSASPGADHPEFQLLYSKLEGAARVRQSSLQVSPPLPFSPKSQILRSLAAVRLMPVTIVHSCIGAGDNARPGAG
eukprot:SAG11_NODE_1594_length_4612_cov_11.187458_5_plen_91_part_00